MRYAKVWFRKRSLKWLPRNSTECACLKKGTVFGISYKTRVLLIPWDPGENLTSWAIYSGEGERGLRKAENDTFFTFKQMVDYTYLTEKFLVGMLIVGDCNQFKFGTYLIIYTLTFLTT
jgi:hypothetical protein